MANIIKDIGEIRTRLFDHRPFLNGEIKFFLQEFEEKRGNREIERLFEVLQNLIEIRYSQIDKIKSSAGALLSLQKKIDKSYAICNTILEKEDTFKDGSLEKKRELRKAEWEVFIQGIAQKCANIDEDFNLKEKKLCDYYTNLEKNLYSSQSE